MVQPFKTWSYGRVATRWKLLRVGEASQKVADGNSVKFPAGGQLNSGPGNTARDHLRLGAWPVVQLKTMLIVLCAGNSKELSIEQGIFVAVRKRPAWMISKPSCCWESCDEAAILSHFQLRYRSKKWMRDISVAFSWLLDKGRGPRHSAADAFYY